MTLKIAALPRARHMFPQDLAARVTAASGMLGGAERRSLAGVAGVGLHLSTHRVGPRLVVVDSF
jgi:hypothetical protein